MAFTSLLKTQVDLPTWEWLRFAPAASVTLSALTTGDSLTERYVYYLSGATFYRYDTISDGWQQLATPNIAALTVMSLRYTTYGGYRMRTISAGASTVTCAVVSPELLKGKTLRILSGTGAGQERTITDASIPVIADHGVVTTVTANQLTDTTRKWIPNQWVGYQVRIVHDAGASQVRKVLYNDATNLYLSDTNYQAIDPWSNTGFAATAPYAIPVATAGVQSHYVIESGVITVNTPWTVQPDYTSRLQVLSGAIFLLSSSAAAPFYTLQIYDVLSDVWYNRTTDSNLILAALGTDVTFERTGEYGGIFDSGTATVTGTSTVALGDTSKTWVPDRYANYQVRITGGTGIGQRKRIVGNTASVMFIDSKWTVTPDATTTYSVYGNTDNFYLMGNANGTILQYLAETDQWCQGSAYYNGMGVTSSMTATMLGTQPVGVTSATRYITAVTSVTTAPIAGGTNYVLGDVLTLTSGGTATVVVTGITAGGVVSAVQLLFAGTGSATVGTSATTGGTGTLCTIAIATIGTVGRIATAINHFFQIGQSVTFAGAVEAAWNTTYTVLATNSLTGFDVVTTATATAVVANALTTSLVVDSSQNWTVGEHVGRLVQVSLAGYNSASCLTRRITANTATTLTLQSAGTVSVNGTSRYVIHDVQAFGKDTQFRIPNRDNRGFATGGSTTTLVDSTVSWIPNQWANYKFRILCGTGVGNEITVTSNTSTTLTYSTQTFTPDATTKYILMDTFGLATGTFATTTLADSTKNWIVNQWAGKRVRITSGSGQGGEATIASNTNNTLTFGAIPVTTGADSTYTILGCMVKGAGVQAQWAFGNTDTTIKGKYIWTAIGSGSTRFDRYDITTEMWEYGWLVSPQTETLSTGSMYTYDGADRIYFTSNATGRVFLLNLTTFQIDASGITPYAHGAALVGNRMEIIKTADGLQYLYIMRHSGQELWRSLIYW